MASQSPISITRRRAMSLVAGGGSLRSQKSEATTDSRLTIIQTRTILPTDQPTRKYEAFSRLLNHEPRSLQCTKVCKLQIGERLPACAAGRRRMICPPPRPGVSPRQARSLGTSNDRGRAFPLCVNLRNSANMPSSTSSRCAFVSDTADLCTSRGLRCRDRQFAG
jgi:hypothetical protein